jgi:hypothetical protein
MALNDIEILLEVGYIIIKAHIVLIIIILISYILEKLLGLKLLFSFFKWKKSKKNAEIHLDGHTIFYLLILVLTFVFSEKGKNFKFNMTTISAFILLVIPFLLLFRKLYSKYQGKDFSKSDSDLP